MASFPPLVGSAPRILVLGTMPGVASLAAGEYYAHPRNAFWPLMGEIFGFEARASYRSRTAALTGAGIAVWDVLASCVRPGSLDAAIEAASVRPNDLAGLFAQHPSLTRIVFNGAQAQAYFRRHAGNLGGGSLECRQVPSSSPANARDSYATKLARWRAAFAVG